MQLFIQQQNILFFRKQLALQPTETQRQQLLRLLAEEEAKVDKTRGGIAALA